MGTMNGESELKYKRDEKLHEESKPLIEDGWQFLPDPFADACQNPLPVFSDANAGIAASVPQLTCLHEAFCYFQCNAMQCKEKRRSGEMGIGGRIGW